MYLLFDIGGTKMRVATSKDGVTLNDVKKWDTPDRFEDVFNILSDYKDSSFESVAGALAGVFDKEKSGLVRSPNLQNWVGVPIREKFQEFFMTDVVLENDAALAGLGEACFGAGRDKKIVTYLTISTGIGGARIVDRKIDCRTWGFEPGNQIIDTDLSIWPDSISLNSKDITEGSVESYISGAAIEKRFGKPACEIDDAKVWGEVEKLLAVLLNNTISCWSPDVVVLGGGLILESAIDLNRVKGNLQELFRVFPEIPEIKKAELGDVSALYGCLSLVKGS